MNGQVPAVPRPRWMVPVLLLLMVGLFILLLGVSERSVLKTCLDIAGSPSPGLYSWCIDSNAPIPPVDENTTVEERFQSHLKDSLDGHTTRTSLTYSIIGVAAGLFLALTLILILPAEQIQFTGKMEKYGGAIRLGGAGGFAVIVAVAGGVLANQIPKEEAQVINERAFNKLLQSYDIMSDKYEALRDEMQNTDRSIWHSLLTEGHFRPHQAAIKVFCEEGRPSLSSEFADINAQSLVAIIGGDRGPPREIGAPIDIPIGRLSNSEAIEVKIVPDKGDFTKRQPDHIYLEYFIDGQAEETRSNSVFETKLQIFVPQLNEYCDRRGNLSRY